MHKNTSNMNETVLECSQCKRKCDKEEEFGTDICGHRKCRECISAGDCRNCYQCAIPGTSTMQQVQTTCAAAAVSGSPRKKDSKIANQTHIVEEYKENGALQYHCTFCDKRFSSRTQRYYHINCNKLDSESYECDICKKTFARLSQLKYHKESHTSPINKCLICHKNYSNPIALRKHENLHKAEPKSCPHCKKTFVQKISLEQHIASKHLNQLQYECNKCDKKYASKSTLALHMQSHEEKRFKCPICAKLYQRNSILTIHLKTHERTEDEPGPYVCEICKKDFTESISLARHRKIHDENELIYHCTECGANIPRKDNMTRHIFSMHPVYEFDDIVEMIKPSPEMFEERHLNYLRRREFCPENYNSTSKENHNYYDNYVKSKQLENNETVEVLENKQLNSSNVVPYLHNNEYAVVNQFESASNNTSSVNQIEVTLPPNRYLYEYFVGPRLQYRGNYVLSITHDQEPRTFEQCQVYNQVQLQNQIEYNQTSALHFDQANYFKKPETITASIVETYPPYVINEPIDLANTKSAYNVYTYPPYGHNEPIDLANAKSAWNIDTHPPYVTNEPIDLAIYQTQSAPTEIDEELEIVVSTSQPDLEAASTSYFATIDQNEHNKTSVIRSIGDVRKHLTPQPSAVSPQSTVSEKSASHFPQHTEYKHKKYNRHYNVKLYRKILGCDEDNDTEDNKQRKQQQQGSRQVKKQQSSGKTRKSTPVHWRKNFKNSYETSATEIDKELETIVPTSQPDLEAASTSYSATIDQDEHYKTQSAATEIDKELEIIVSTTQPDLEAASTSYPATIDQDEHYKTQSSATEIDKELEIIVSTTQPDLEAASTSYSATIDQDEHYKTSVIRSISEVTKHLTPQPSAVSPQSTVSEKSASHFPQHTEYKHKKYNRHYNVKLYRKILGCDEDNKQRKQQQQGSRQVKKQQSSSKTRKSTPVHWRKNFKNNYETSATEIDKELEIIVPTSQPDLEAASTSYSATIDQDEHYKTQSAATEIDKELEIIVPTSQPDLEAASTSYSATIDQDEHYKTSVIRSKSDVTKYLTPQPSAVSPQSTVSEKSASHFPQHTEYKHKKYNRHYNVKLYRKILDCDVDNKQEKQQQQGSRQVKKQQSSSKARKSTPVHWRKNFKNSYKTSATEIDKELEIIVPTSQPDLEAASTSYQDEHYKTQSAATEIDKELEIIVPTSQPDLEAASTSYSATIGKDEHYKTLVVRSKSDVTKYLTPQPSAVSPQSAVSEKTASHFPQHTEYKHKKYNRHYNVKLYRKILDCDVDNKQEKQQQQGSRQVKKQQSSNKPRKSTPVHWRKNFKNSYETSGS